MPRYVAGICGLLIATGGKAAALHLMGHLKSNFTQVRNEHSCAN